MTRNIWYCIAVLLVCASSPALAQDDFARPGCYLGLGGANAFEGSGDLDQGAPGLQVRAGCRATEWAGFELHYEGIDDLGDRWALSVDGKLYPLHGRIQPFASLGFGYARLDDRNVSWDFAVRPGGGIDFYVTRNIAINLNTSYVRPIDDGPAGDYISLGWGFLYRF